MYKFGDLVGTPNQGWQDRWSPSCYLWWWEVGGLRGKIEGDTKLEKRNYVKLLHKFYLQLKDDEF
ncbi:MAG: hypothetical protein IPN87_09760 [Saprospiraceae bacterium]|nr:hypothetical protein [Candidatus Brachybacter algidus]